MYFAHLLDFIQTWILIMLNVLEYGETWTEF